MLLEAIAFKRVANDFRSIYLLRCALVAQAFAELGRLQINSYTTELMKKILES